MLSAAPGFGWCRQTIAAGIRADLEHRGQMIEAHDRLIAGHARSRGPVVATGNPGAFNRVAALRWEDWPAWAGPPSAPADATFPSAVQDLPPY